jgi:hypothetical protein
MDARRTLLVALALAGVVASGLLVPLSHAGERGQCTSAIVDEPFRLPDGTLSGPAKLTLCASVKYSPVSWLHKTYLDGYQTTMLISRCGTTEALPGEGEPFMMLYRDVDGLLHLDGYAIRAGNKMVTYRLDLARVKAEQRLAKRRGPARKSAGPSTLILAAKVN